MVVALGRALRRAATRPRLITALLVREDATSSLEFAIVAAPFVALLVALVETMVVFFAGRMLDVVVTEASRKILTGSAQTSNMTQSGFATLVCQNVRAWFNCNNLMIDVETYSSFCTANTTMPALTFNAQGQVTNTWQYTPGNAGDIVVVRVMYQWPIVLAPLGFNLSNLSNGKRLLMSTAVFKNEPY